PVAVCPARSKPAEAPASHSRRDMSAIRTVRLSCLPSCCWTHAASYCWMHAFVEQAFSLPRRLSSRRVLYSQTHRPEPALPRPAKPPLRFLPIDYVPPRGDIFRTAILIFQIISMLPNIQTNHSDRAFHNRRILISAGNNINLSAAFDQPGPARPKPRGSRSRELLLESGEPAERAVDRRGKLPDGLASRARTNDGPEQGVVAVTAAIV